MLITEASYDLSTVESAGPAEVQFLPLNWDDDFVASSSAGTDTTYLCATSDVDAPFTVRVATAKVANVYAGQNIDPLAMSAQKNGVRILSEVRPTYVQTSDEDDAYRKIIPVRVGISLTIPANTAITSAMLDQSLALAIAGLANGHAETALADGIDRLRRGSTSKKS